MRCQVCASERVGSRRSNSSDVRCSRTDLDRPGTHPRVRSVETQTVDTPIEESDLLGTDQTLWCKRTEERSGTLLVAFDDGFSSSALRNSCYPQSLIRMEQWEWL